MRKQVALLGRWLASLQASRAPEQMRPSPPRQGDADLLGRLYRRRRADLRRHGQGVQPNHPNIQVDMTIEPWDTIAQKLPTAMATGAGPDIATPDYNVGTIREYIKEGLIAPIDSLLGTGRTRSRQRHPSRHQSRLYGQRPSMLRRPTGRPWSFTTTRPVR